jgi:hypothetical protein
VRSPVTDVEKLLTPLLIRTNTNDDDVSVLEVEHLIQALKAAGKKFEYEIFKDAPGGHGFDRIDTKLAKETRLKIYKFLAGYLKPPFPFPPKADKWCLGYHGGAHGATHLWLTSRLRTWKKQDIGRTEKGFRIVSMA